MKLKRADYILILAILLSAVALCILFYFYATNEQPKTAVISVGGEVYTELLLSQDNTLVIEENGNRNVVEVKNGKVRMVQSDCSGKECVNQGEIALCGECIICLPNRVTVTISGEDDGYDAISW